MGLRALQPSFTGGEIAPSLYARVDLARYSTSLRTCRNFIVQRHGGVLSRPGTQYLGTVAVAGVASRLIEFTIDATTAIVCEFSVGLVRFWQQGAAVPAWTLATPYLADELRTLQVAQVGLVMTIVHPLHAPRVLTFTGAAFILGLASFGPSTAAPGAPVIVRQTVTAPTQRYDYCCTRVDPVTGEESRASAVTTTVCNLSTTTPVTLAIPDSPCNIYRGRSGQFGFIGSTSDFAFTDDNIIPDYSDPPPSWRNPFEADGFYPRTITHFQQRRWLAGSLSEPQTVYGSVASELTNFGAASPARDDDAIDATLAAVKRQDIRHLVALNRLLVMTSRGEWSADAGDTAVLTPNNTGFSPESTYGASDLPPVITDEGAVYVQAQGTRIRDLVYNAQLQQYGGTDLSILASHLFIGYSIVDMAWSSYPHSCVWCVRNDGVLLALTYLREQEVWGWSRHETDGAVERVCVAREGSEDRVYLVVRRTVDGAAVRFLERMTDRFPADPLQMICVDASLSYDGRNRMAATVRLFGSLWSVGQPITATFTGGVPPFPSADDALQFLDADGSILFTCRVTVVQSPGLCTVVPNRDVPANYRNVEIASWAWAQSALSGLEHLRGRTVSGLVDGMVVADLVVSSAGVVTLPTPGAVVHLGLPYTCTMETLDLALPNAGTVRDRQKVVSKATVTVERTRGLFVGLPDEELIEAKTRETEGYLDAVRLITDAIEVRFPSTWETSGRVRVEQRDPLPCTVLSIIPEVTIGG